MLSRLRQGLRALRHRPRTSWDGPAAYTDEVNGVPVISGFYALAPDGRRHLSPPLRLVCIDDAPGNPHDGSCHYEIAGKLDPPTKAGRPVALEASLRGRGQVLTPPVLVAVPEPEPAAEPAPEPEPEPFDPELAPYIDQAHENPDGIERWLNAEGCHLNAEQKYALRLVIDQVRRGE